MAETSRDANYEKNKHRANYAELDAIDPHDGGIWTVLLSPKTIAWAAGQGLGASRELIDTVRWGLRNPRFLFRGLRDELFGEIDGDDWLCYACTPPHAYNWKTGERSPPWDDEVFLICITEERVVYGWRWCGSDAGNPHLPISHATRFKEQVF